jgi:cell division protein ZapE
VFDLRDPTRRFIYLVDEFYDRRVKLLVRAEQSILDLYQGEKLAFEIERTRSRLLEMQSEDYLRMDHRVEDAA